MNRLAAGMALMLAIASFVFPQSRDALELYRAGRYADAVETTLAELAQDGRNLNAHTVLGWSLNALGRYDEALNYGMQGLEVSRYDNRIIEIVAEAHFYLGNNDDALRYLAEYAAIAPTGDLIDEIYNFIGEIYLRQEMYQHADIALTTAVFHNPARSRWWARLGYAREKAGDAVYAREAYNQALQRDRDLLEAQRGLDRLANG